MPLPETGRAERAAWLRLLLTPGVGPAAARDLLQVFGLPEDVLGAGRPALAKVVGERLANAISAGAPERETAVEHALQWAQAPDNHLLSIADAGYPAALLQIGDPPPLLYLRGDPRVLARPMLGIVGSRSATRSGLETAKAFSAALAEAGLTIASGLALGIDAAAHRGALGTPAGTLAVLGTGADIAYPATNRELGEAIVERGGALISELPLGTGPREANFPRRNRLIAGLSLGVLVVEAAVRSGSLITARLAGEFGREVFAIPGSIHSPQARGCHQLIKQGAKLVESAQDVLAELGRFEQAPSRPGDRAGGRAGDRAGERSGEPVGGRAGQRTDERHSGPAGEEDPVLQALGWDPVGIETLARRASGIEGGFPELAARLLALEMSGRVERLADGRYQRRGPG